MALSFGRKKGEAANEATNSPAPAQANTAQTKTGTEEPIDESWFETFSDEATANPTVSASATASPLSSAPSSDFSTSSLAPEPDFSVFDTDVPEDLGDFGTKIDLPSQTSAPASSSSLEMPSSGTTPFDLPAATTAAPAADKPVKKGGGLKKVLPVLLALLIVGGGGAFWYSQRPGNPDESDDGAAMTPPSVPAGAPAPAPSAPPSSAPPSSDPPAATDPIPPAPGASPPGAKSPPPKPAGAKPVAAKPDDSPIKPQLKALWNEGLKLRNQNKIAAAKAKWGAAVRLARSKPGNEKSADMIQQAINKLK